jgi:hypothetical protein
MRDGGCAVGADLQTIDPVRQAAQSAFDAFGIVRNHRPLAAFHRRGQFGDALLEADEGIIVAGCPGELVDLGREQMHVLGQPRQRLVGGDVGDDGAQRRDGIFQLLRRAGIVVGAQDRVELAAERADRLVVAGELFGRHQRAQHLADVRQRLLDTGERLRLDAALAVVVDAARQRAYFALDGLDRPARHRFQDRRADFAELAAEGVDRLVQMIGTLQRLDLARDLEQMLFQRAEVRPGRHCGRDRRHLRRRHLILRRLMSCLMLCLARRCLNLCLPRRRSIELALARGDLGHGKIE